MATRGEGDRGVAGTKLRLGGWWPRFSRNERAWGRHCGETQAPRVGGVGAVLCGVGWPEAKGLGRASRSQGHSLDELLNYFCQAMTLRVCWGAAEVRDGSSKGKCRRQRHVESSALTSALPETVLPTTSQCSCFPINFLGRNKICPASSLQARPHPLPAFIGDIREGVLWYG